MICNVPKKSVKIVKCYGNKTEIFTDIRENQAMKMPSESLF